MTRHPAWYLAHRMVKQEGTAYLAGPYDCPAKPGADRVMIERLAAKSGYPVGMMSGGYIIATCDVAEEHPPGALYDPRTTAPTLLPRLPFPFSPRA